MPASLGFTPKVGKKFGRDFEELRRASVEEQQADTGATDLDAPHYRFVRCSVCKTLDAIPDTGPDPREANGLRDPFIERVREEHERRHPETMRWNPGPMLVFRVEARVWDHPKTGPELLKKVWADKPTPGGFVPEAYAIKDTFKEDAIKCFRRHHEPQDGCIDYKEDLKILGNSLPTEASPWQEKNRAKIARQQAPVYLCDFCPVKSWVQLKVNDKKQF